MYQEFAGKQDDMSFYKAYFTVELINSKIGDKAILTLTISANESNTELIGFHLKTK